MIYTDYKLPAYSFGKRVSIPKTKIMAFNVLPFIVKERISNTMCGIEIEVEAHGAQAPTPDCWMKVADNSLRNSGAEYITRFGTRAGQVYDFVVELEKMMANNRAAYGNHFFQFTERTSVHVHLDVRGWVEEQVQNLIILYTLFEPILFKFVTPERQHNIFCVPLGKASIINTSEGTTFQNVLRSWSKYCAFNLLPVSKYGTVEFRHMEGNCDPDYIFSWVCLLTLMHNYAALKSNREIRKFIEDIKCESNYVQAIEEVFHSFSQLLRIVPEEIDAAASDAKFFFLQGSF